VLLIDCHLANRDGWGVLRAARRSDFVRCRCDDLGLDRSIECMHHGASAFVMKPFAHRLINLVRA
jgi:DNA-binding response OmpR family regulator